VAALVDEENPHVYFVHFSLPERRS
jgi:hypothetical protein